MTIRVILSKVTILLLGKLLNLIESESLLKQGKTAPLANNSLNHLNHEQIKTHVINKLKPTSRFLVLS